MDWRNKCPWLKPKKKIEEVKPLDPQAEVKLFEQFMQTYEFKPECKYVFWFQRSIKPEYVQLIRNNMLRTFKPDQVILCAGIAPPLIFELKGNENGNIRSDEQHLVSHGEGNSASAEGEGK